MRALLLAVVLLLALPGAALAQVDEAADALRKDPVYVDPSAPLAGDVDADALRQKIRDSDASPIYIAVIPEVDGQSANATLRALHDAVGIAGTYAVVAGHSFRAGSDDVSGASRQATIAAQENSGDLQGALEDFIGRVGDLQAGRSPSGSGTSGVPVFGIFLLVVIVGGGLLLFVGNRRRKEREAAELVEVKENVRDDLVALGDDIRALDLDVELPDADPRAKADYAQAVECYERANRVFETARSTRDLGPAAEALEEGRYAMTSAKARLAGQEPPERRAPCFFDPRHGPSSREVMWSPPAPIGGTPRPVPACEADAQRVERGEDPQARELVLGGRRVPYWEAGPAYAPFYGGFYGGFGGFLPGLLLGSMMGGGWGDSGGGWGGGGGDWGGGGDFGGGGFGGGDFGGGGGFGGGDF